MIERSRATGSASGTRKAGRARAAAARPRASRTQSGASSDSDSGTSTPAAPPSASASIRPASSAVAGRDHAERARRQDRHVARLEGVERRHACAQDAHPADLAIGHRGLRPARAPRPPRARPRPGRSRGAARPGWPRLGVVSPWCAARARPSSRDPPAGDRTRARTRRSGPPGRRSAARPRRDARPHAPSRQVERDREAHDQAPEREPHDPLPRILLGDQDAERADVAEGDRHVEIG